MKRKPVILACLFCCCLLVPGCTKKTTKVDTAPAPEPQVIEPEPAPEPAPEPEIDQTPLILVPVYFDYDKYNLRPDAISVLEKVAPFLRENASMRVKIEGHADERGTDEYNIGLGENRAKSARNYLTTYGIASDRLEVVSYGRSRPVNPNCGEDESCHQQNRRVEWVVLSR